MGKLTKDIFISSIESIQLQFQKDISNSALISQVFNSDIDVYDNSLLIRTIIKLLQVHFPIDENGFCEISHYCFDMNFGKVTDRELTTIDDLWHQLKKA